MTTNSCLDLPLLAMLNVTVPALMEVLLASTLHSLRTTSVGPLAAGAPVVGPALVVGVDPGVVPGDVEAEVAPVPPPVVGEPADVLATPPELLLVEGAPAWPAPVLADALPAFEVVPAPFSFEESPPLQAPNNRVAVRARGQRYLFIVHSNVGTEGRQPDIMAELSTRLWSRTVQIRSPLLVGSAPVESIFDLPAHPLFVHTPLVLMPLLALVALALALRPRWRVSFGPVAALGGVGLLIVTILATQSGQAFYNALERQGQEVSIEDHQELAETTRLLVILFVASLLVLVAVSWIRSTRSSGSVRSAGDRSLSAAQATSPDPLLVWMGHGLAALTVVLGVAGSIWMFRTGHEGASVVWDGTLREESQDDNSGSGSSGENDAGEDPEQEREND